MKCHRWWREKKGKALLNVGLRDVWTCLPNASCIGCLSEDECGGKAWVADADRRLLLSVCDAVGVGDRSDRHRRQEQRTQCQIVRASNQWTGSDWRQVSSLLCLYSTTPALGSADAGVSVPNAGKMQIMYSVWVHQSDLGTKLQNSFTHLSTQVSATNTFVSLLQLSRNSLVPWPGLHYYSTIIHCL